MRHAPKETKLAARFLPLFKVIMNVEIKKEEE